MINKKTKKQKLKKGNEQWTSELLHPFKNSKAQINKANYNCWCLILMPQPLPHSYVSRPKATFNIPLPTCQTTTWWGCLLSLHARHLLSSLLTICHRSTSFCFYSSNWDQMGPTAPADASSGQQKLKPFYPPWWKFLLPLSTGCCWSVALRPQTP